MQGRKKGQDSISNRRNWLIDAHLRKLSRFQLCTESMLKNLLIEAEINLNAEIKQSPMSRAIKADSELNNNRFITEMP